MIRTLGRASFVCLSFGCAIAAEGQAFTRRFDAWASQLPETGFGIERSDSGYLAFVGSYYIDDTLLYTSVLTTLQLNLLGEPLDTHMVFIPQSATYPGWANVAFPTSNGKYGVGGGIVEQDGTKRPLLYIFDAGGGIESVFSFGNAGEEWIGYQGKRTLDDGYAICGITTSSGTSVDGFLLKIDSLGNQEWVQTYGLSNKQEYVLSVDLAPDGGYYLGGTRALVPGSYDHWVVRVDSAGGELWSYDYGTVYDDPYAAHLESLQNGDLVFGTGWAQDNFGTQRLGMARIDLNGAVVWSKSYDGPGFAGSFFAVKEIGPNGDLIAAGQSFVPGYEQGVILRTSASGDSLWLRYYHYYDSLWTEGLGRFLDVIQTNDGGFIAVGAAYGSNSPADTLIQYSQDTWVVKVDSMGCLEPGCNGIGTITDQITNLRDALTIAPNPAHGRVTVSWALPTALRNKGMVELSLVNAQGKLLRTWPCDLSRGNCELDVSAFAAGIYHLHVVHAGTWITGGKLVVE